MTQEQERLLTIILNEVEEAAILHTLAAALESRNTMKEEYNYLNARAVQHANKWLKAVKDLTRKTLEELYT